MDKLCEHYEYPVLWDIGQECQSQYCTTCSAAWHESTCSIRTLSQLWLDDNHLLVAEVSEAFHWLSYSSWRLPLGDEHYTGFVPLKFLQNMNVKMSSTKFIHTLYCCLRQIRYLFINMLHMLGLAISATKVWSRTIHARRFRCLYSMKAINFKREYYVLSWSREY